MFTTWLGGLIIGAVICLPLGWILGVVMASGATGPDDDGNQEVTL